MSKTDKLIAKMLQTPTPEDFSWNELQTLLGKLGYEKKEGRGARVKFMKPGEIGSLICLHKPHPSPDVDRGALKAVLATLIERGDINE